MSRIASVILRERRLSSLCFRHIIHKKSLYSISSTCSFPLCRNQNHHQLVFEQKFSVLNKIKDKFNSFISDMKKAKVGGCLAFEKIGDDIDYTEFLQCFELPDTFQSWFLALELHVWMTISATVTHKKGKLFKISLIDSMWNHVELKMEKLAKMKSSTMKKELKELAMEFQTGLMAYDEGILSDDTVLAAAAWRMLYDCKPVHPQLLENAVLYIRKQLQHLESQNIPDIVFQGTLSFLPLNCILSDEEMSH